MNEKEEINKIITEKLFETCWHDYDESLPSDSPTYCAKCKKILRGRLNRNFCNSDADIREARKKLAEKDLDDDFAFALMDEVIPKKDQIKSIGGMKRLFNLINAEPLFQARAICRVLENL